MSRWAMQVDVERSTICTFAIAHTPFQISGIRIVLDYLFVLAGEVRGGVFFS